ncbi:hypothetical protein HWV62_3665 [Athelia sp. TMB]|nr:hypothetical protein HWV62_3665 [Athelia sp. TMB]
MTAICLQPSLPTGVLDGPAVEVPLAPAVTTLPIIDFSVASPEEAYRGLSLAASTTGVGLLTNLVAKPPIRAIQRLFATLYSRPDLASRLNATYPLRGVFKNAALDPSSPQSIDQKTTIDLSVARLQKLRELDAALVEDLGPDFTTVLEFYAVVENNVLPLLMKATSSFAGADLTPLHKARNNNLRLIDYFPTAAAGPRCGEHRDYGTFTIVFQDGAVGGLEFEVNGRWEAVPAQVDAVVSWGWCGAILSNDGVLAAKHRVMRTVPALQRRTTAVIFVAPDLDTALKPVDGSSVGNWTGRILEGKLGVGEFKEVIAKKWRHREGNGEEKREVVEGEQDKEVIAFVRGYNG